MLHYGVDSEGVLPMQWWMWLLVFLSVPIALIFLYGHVYAQALTQCFRAYLAQFENKDRTETLVVRTDGFLPFLGEKPPERAMWRVKTGLYFFEGQPIVTYRYDPEQFGNADLDDPANIEAEVRSMEAHGRAILESRENEGEKRDNR